MLSRKEEFLLSHPNSFECIDHGNPVTKIKVNTGLIKHPYLTGKEIMGGNYYFIGKTFTYQAPHGGYCHDCMKAQFEKVYFCKETGKIIDTVGMSFEDGSVLKFWQLCKKCELKKDRSKSAKRWTDVIKEIDPHFNHTRLATFTIPNPRYCMQTMFDPFGFEFNFDKDEDMKRFLDRHSRPNWFENSEGELNFRNKYISDIPLLLEEEIYSYRKKLLKRFSNMRNNKKCSPRFRKKVKGGIVVFECTINLYPETKEVEIHPHLHAILYGSHYENRPDKGTELTDDWGLGIAHIRKIENRWIAQLEVAKYIGKDGSRRTSFGKLREVNRKINQKEKHKQVKASK